MLTRLKVKNFKTLEEIDIPLGPISVFIGPDNSGKTTALQAIALWESGLREWTSRRGQESTAKKRTGVTINRRDLTHTPVSNAKQLWHKTRVNFTRRQNDSQETQNIYLDVTLHGDSPEGEWSFGLRFYYANAESIYCRPLLLSEEESGDRLHVPDAAIATKVALLPPMSGLVSEEPELQPGRISVLLGEGQTAQVLRNLCLQVYSHNPEGWSEIQGEIFEIFGVELSLPRRDSARGTIELSYIEKGTSLDLSSAGRGLQQTLLLLTHFHVNKGSVLLLDEPDAHLEILRQRQIYSKISEAARKTGSQLFAASHSEIVLNDAADKDLVVAFVGKAHRIDDRGSQVLKSLKEIGFDQYYQAEMTGVVFYLEGATDLSILKSFARTLGHEAEKVLDGAFVHYVGNQPKSAEHHFFGLREAKPDLQGFALFDRLSSGLPASFSIPSHVWKKREIENYFTTEHTLMRFAAGYEPDDLVGRAISEERREAMQESIKEITDAYKVLGEDPWSDDFKVSDDLLPKILESFFRKTRNSARLLKTDFHTIADFVTPEEISDEVRSVLDKIVEVSQKASPARRE